MKTPALVSQRSLTVWPCWEMQLCDRSVSLFGQLELRLALKGFSPRSRWVLNTMTSLMRLLCSLSNSVVSQFYDFVEFKNVSFNFTNMISVIRAQCEGPSVIQGLFIIPSNFWRQTKKKTNFPQNSRVG